jgi:foldase protein PrsA
MIRHIAAPCAVFLALAGLSACGGGVPSNAVVQVASTPITKAAFDHWMEVAASASASSSGASAAKPVVPDPPNYPNCIAHLEATSAATKGATKPTKSALKSECEQQYKSIQGEVLGFLISSNWVLGESSSLGVKVSDEEVKKQFKTLKAQEFPTAADFEKFLATSGQTVSDVLLRVKLNLLSTKIQQKVVKTGGTISSSEISKYYNENPSRFGTPEKRNVRILLTKTESQANEAKKEIESGTSFASVAKRVSIEPITRSAGGALPGVVKGQESKALNEALFSAKVNAIGGPVKTPFGYYVYVVEKIIPGNQRTLAQSQTAIKQQLTSTKEQAALTKFVKDFKKKWSGKTECRSGYVVMDCKGYKAPAGATGTT